MDHHLPRIYRMNTHPTRPRLAEGIINLHITPKSAKNEILGWISDAHGRPVLKVKIAALPEDGKATAELIKFLAKTWGLPKSAFELVSGETSRHKRLKINAEIPSSALT